MLIDFPSATRHREKQYFSCRNACLKVVETIQSSMKIYQIMSHLWGYVRILKLCETNSCNHHLLSLQSPQNEVVKNHMLARFTSWFSRSGMVPGLLNALENHRSGFIPHLHHSLHDFFFLAQLEDSEAEKVLRDKPRSYSNNFQGKQTMESKYILFKARNDYRKIIECV